MLFNFLLDNICFQGVIKQNFQPRCFFSLKRTQHARIDITVRYAYKSSTTVHLICEVLTVKNIHGSYVIPDGGKPIISKFFFI